MKAELFPVRKLWVWSLLCCLAAWADPCGASSIEQTSGAVSGVQRLCLRTADGRPVFSVPLAEGKEFGIRFIHSVARSPVEEWFRAERGVIRLKRTIYQDFGAGLPFEPGPGQRMTFLRGKIVLAGFDMPLPRFDVRIGRIARHALLLPGDGTCRVVPLETLSPPGTALTFSLENADR